MMFIKNRILIIGIPVILIVSAFVVYTNINTHKKDGLLSDILNNGSVVLLEDTVEKIKYNSSFLYLIKDEINNIHFIVSDKKEKEILLSTKFLGGIGEESNNEIVWLNKHINDKGSYIFCGVIYNNDIKKLTVNDAETSIINYLDSRVFYSDEKFDVPIRIEGYSNSGELIYRNYQ